MIHCLRPRVYLPIRARQRSPGLGTGCPRSTEAIMYLSSVPCVNCNCVSSASNLSCFASFLYLLLFNYFSAPSFLSYSIFHPPLSKHQLLFFTPITAIVVSNKMTNASLCLWFIADNRISVCCLFAHATQRLSRRTQADRRRHIRREAKASTKQAREGQKCRKSRNHGR